MRSFPSARMRRMRSNPGLRELARETRISASDLIHPLFVAEDLTSPREIPPMPGVFQHTLASLAREAEEVAELGIPAVLLFGIPTKKDAIGSEAYSERGVVQEGIRAIKSAAPHLVVIGDVCLCEYTSHGHCGALSPGSSVDNDPTLRLLAKTALAQVEAGADVVAPSAMVDGQVAAIRAKLDAMGQTSTPILAYSAKYASAFYGPFRTAAESAPQRGDRAGYQMQPSNAREAMSEIELDIAEGADAVMVKPALAYLDVISAARRRFDIPLAAYNVSGEYSMVKSAAAIGAIDERRVVLEILTGIARAGADMIITYHAKQVAAWLREEYGG